MPELEFSRTPTIDKLNRVWVETFPVKPRGYLGASSIGEECKRKLWYRFRWAKNPLFDINGIRNIEDGNLQEDVMAERLSKIGVIVEDSQKQVSFLNGFFLGHIDGTVLGILEAPKTRHVWEHKSTKEKKFNELKILADMNEKEALKSWNYVYWAQAQIYMHGLKLKRHYMTVSTPGGRDYTSVRTNYSPKYAKAFIDKARDIISSPEPPARTKTYKCSWCEFDEICNKESTEAKFNCRTCVHSTPSLEYGKWSCERDGSVLTIPMQEEGCSEHFYIPSIFNVEQTDSVHEKNELVQINYQNGAVNKKGKGMS